MKTFRALAFCACLLVGAPRIHAEAPRVVRVPIWVFLESYPATGFDGEGAQTITNAGTDNDPAGGERPAKLPPAEDLRSVARFVLGGMVFGWRFEYVPSDRTRRVEEVFTLEPIAEIRDEDPRFSLSGVDPAYPRVSAWADFLMDETTARRSMYWKSVQFRSADGRGYGALERDSAGIRDAYADAVRAAVRSYARKLEKNKPKEIRGEVLLRENPRLFTDEGRFVADITVLVNIQETVPYALY